MKFYQQPKNEKACVIFCLKNLLQSKDITYDIEHTEAMIEKKGLNINMFINLLGRNSDSQLTKLENKERHGKIIVNFLAPPSPEETSGYVTIVESTKGDSHLMAIRYFNGKWYLLDSMKSAPVAFIDFELLRYFMMSAKICWAAILTKLPLIPHAEVKEKYKVMDQAELDKYLALFKEQVPQAENISQLIKLADFHKVGENHTAEGYPILPNTKELLLKNMDEIEKRVTTRFSTDPNGILHIGHAKDICTNFGYAVMHDGVCYLRFDDTNSEKEEVKFSDAIKDVVKWLGYNFKVKYFSDYFDELYERSATLIREKIAYVCHQTTEEMHEYNIAHSPCRDRPIEESLKLFKDMKNGKFEEGTATLRLKHSLEEGKVDPVAYEVKNVSHLREMGKWFIYPTYDYAYYLCDLIENITHSLCTKELQSRQSSYYPLCKVFDCYTLLQCEYAHLNMSYTVTSKKKIEELIREKVVRDYDDPRLFTLTGLRRRGVPAEAVNKFVAKMGLTVAQTTVDPHLFDSVVRDHLNIHAPRTMVVLEPLKLIILNYAYLNLESKIKVPDFPTDASKKSFHEVNVDSIVYIEHSDYKDKEEEGFQRLTKEQTVGLKYLGLVLKVVKEHKNSESGITELAVFAEKADDKNKPKAFIHWVCKPSFAEVRLFEQLFKSRNPDDETDEFLENINPDTFKFRTGCAIDEYLSKSKIYDRYQFEGIGYFGVDPDSETSKQLIFNRTVSLKEDAGKK